MTTSYGTYPAGWEAQILQGIGAPITGPNVLTLDVWAGREGPNSYYNPLNTTLQQPGSYAVNSVGVQGYPNWATGLQANVSTLLQSNFSDIVAALRTGFPSSLWTGYHPSINSWSGGGYSNLSPAGYSAWQPSMQYSYGPGSTNTNPPASYTYLPGTTGSTPVVGGIQQTIENPGGVAGNVAGQVGSSVTGPVVSWATGILNLFVTSFGHWLVLIGLGIAELVVLDQLFSGGKGAATVAKAAAA